MVPEIEVDEKRADHALRIFKRLRLPDVFGTPTIEEAGAEWAYPLVRVIFGTYNAKTKRRAVQEYFLLVPKKNSKSTFAAAIMLVALIVNERLFAEAVLIAPTKLVAENAFGQAERMVKIDAELSKILKPRSHKRLIEHLVTGAVLIIKAADTETITGIKAVYILIDETHEFSSKARAKEVFREIRGALAAAPDGFLIQITTQSKRPPAGVFKEELAMARDVRDGVVQASLLPVLFEIPERLSRNGGWRDEKYWGLVNPNLNKSVDLAFLREQLMKADRAGPEDLALVASQHFNVQVGSALRNDGWVGALYWEAASEENLTLDALIARCDVAVVGIDGGGLDDLLGVTVIGRENGRMLQWSHAWAHKDVLERRKEIAPTLLDFEKDGDLTVCDYPTQDIDEVSEIVDKVFKAGLLPEKYGVGVDPVGIGAILNALNAMGISDDVIMPVAQGYRLNAAILGSERALKDGTLRHDGSAMMNWCVTNVKIELKGNAVVMGKSQAGIAKIDPLISAMNAFTLMSRNPQSSGSGLKGYIESLTC